MSARTRIPSLLEHIIKLPKEHDVIVITGVVDVSQHWIVLRFLGRFLQRHRKCAPAPCQDEASTTRHANEEKGEEDEDVGVVLVSWMRDVHYWQIEARKAAGVDLAAMADQHRFAFVDGLTSFFATEISTDHPAGPKPWTNLAFRQPVPARGPIPSRTSATAPAPAADTITQEPVMSSKASHHTLSSSALDLATETISTAINSLQLRNKRIFLILDSPSLILATNPSLTPHELSCFVLGLRKRVHSALISAEADSPLVMSAIANNATTTTTGIQSSTADYSSMSGHGCRHPTPLETRNAAFLLGQAHLARWVLGVRALDTGAARDVSGVLAVRRGGAWSATSGMTGYGGLGAHDGDGAFEALFALGMDGGVKVFQRGAGDAS